MFKPDIYDLAYAASIWDSNTVRCVSKVTSPTPFTGLPWVEPLNDQTL